MSKRAGDFVTLREVVDEVGRDAGPLHDAVPQERRAARFRLRQGDRAVEGQSGLLRAVRPCPLRLGVPAGAARRSRRLTCRAATLAEADLSGSADEAEIDVIRRIAQCPRIVEARPRRTSRTGSPSTSTTSPAPSTRLWNKGKDLPQLRFVNQSDRTVDGGETGSRSCGAGRAWRPVSPSWASRPPTRCARSDPCSRPRAGPSSR